MRIVSVLRSIWRNLFRRGRAERDLEDELRAYVDLLADEYERAGLAPALARRAALVDSGGIEQAKEATRDVWTGNVFATAGRELRYAVRSLARAPGFFITAVATLTIGIGGATAMFTIIKGSLWRPLPGVGEPDRLVTVERLQHGQMVGEFSYPDFLDLRRRSTALSGLAAFNGTYLALDDSAGSARPGVSYVSDNFFSVLGLRPAAGRLFGVGEKRTDVVVMGYHWWQHRFGGSPAAIGTSLHLEGHPFTIIGVAPPEFVGAMAPYPMDLFIPLAIDNRASPVLQSIDLDSRRPGYFRLVGRLAQGRSVDDVQRDLAAIAAYLAAAHPTNRGRSVRVWSGASMLSDELAAMSRVPALLAMAVGVLLLIACGNVAGLSLVRSAARRRELATRLTLGATRAALVRQVAFEGVVVAASASILGVIVAQLLMRSATLVRTVVPLDNPDLGLDLRVLALGVAAATVTAIIVSVFPSHQIVRIPPGAVLKEGGGAGRRRSGGQRTLVVVQVGASLVLLVAAAAVFGSFQRILAAHAEFEPHGLTDVRLETGARNARLRGLDSVRNSSETGFYEELIERAASDPDIEAAAVTSTIPPFQWSTTATLFRHGEEPPLSELVGREGELGWRAQTIAVSPGFFGLMRIPLLRGRGFGAADDGRSEPVAILSHELAQALWPAQDPIGEVVAWPAIEGPPRQPVRIIGVATDTRDVFLSDEPPLAMYISFKQYPDYNRILLLRGRGSAQVSEAAVRRLVVSVNPTVAVLRTNTLEARLHSELRPQRTASAWIGVFGVVALLLACVGLYGVVAQSVLQRMRELAIRLALGATPRRILVDILGDGMRLAAIGGVVGVFGVVVVQRVLRSLFAGVEPGVGAALAMPVGLLAIAVLAACYLPARRAARCSPADVLRTD